MTHAAKSDAKNPSDSGTKKRRLSGSSSSSDSKLSLVSPVAKMQKTSLYADITRLEETQAEKFSHQQSRKLFLNTCDSMKSLLDKMLENKLKLKKSASNDPKDSLVQRTQSELSALRVKFCFLYLSLKKLNRLDKLRTRKCREATTAAKQSVDTFHLQLQNLRYEVLHLRKEVAKCLQFKSRDQDFDLVSIDEFYRTAPPELSKPDKTKITGEEHKLRLARLDFENLQRKKMYEEHASLEKDKERIVATIKEQKVQLSNLKPQLAAILEKTKYVQKYLDMPLDEERNQLMMAEYLPAPLFILFSEMRAYAHACDKDLQVTVKGNLEEAKLESISSRYKRDRIMEEDDGEDNPNGDEDAEDDDQRKCKAKTRRREVTSSEETGGGKVFREDKAVKIFKVHPLTVMVKISLKPSPRDHDAYDSFQLVFSYFSFLELVAVKVHLHPSKESLKILQGSAEREVFSAGSLFAYLNANDKDVGSSSPNPTNFYQLRRQLHKIEFPEDKINRVGALYLWAQKLSGKNFPKNFEIDCFNEGDAEETEEEKLNSKVDKTICQNNVEVIVSGLKERYVARLALQRQLMMMEHKCSKPPCVDDLPFVPKDTETEFPSHIKNRIRGWYSVTWEQYVALDVTRHLVETGVVTSNDFFYRLQLNREPATLIALVAIGQDYPHTPPVFCLNLHWNGEHNLHNSEHIRALEKEVNTSFAYLATTDSVPSIDGNAKDDYNHYEMLSLQIRRLMACFDVLLESWNAVQGGQSSTDSCDFSRASLFLQSVRGRRRAPPLKYQHRMQLFIQ